MLLHFSFHPPQEHFVTSWWRLTVWTRCVRPLQSLHRKWMWKMFVRSSSREQCFLHPDHLNLQFTLGTDIWRSFLHPSSGNACGRKYVIKESVFCGIILLNKTFKVELTGSKTTKIWGNKSTNQSYSVRQKHIWEAFRDCTKSYQSHQTYI